MTITQTTARLLLKIHAVTFRFNPPYTYTSGIKSPMYTDNRVVMSYPDIRRKIVNLYIQIIKKEIGLKNIDYISATATAAIPQGSWIADKLNLPMVFVRSSKKTYGKENQMEGYLKKGSKVLIIEDLISTGKSSIGNAMTIRKLGGKVKHCVATTTYEMQKAKDTFKENKIKLFTLTTGRIIAEEAEKLRLLTGKQKESVHQWFNDPISWEKLVALDEKRSDL